MKGPEAGTARRYARALLDVALAKKDAALGADLDTLAALYSGQPELRRVLLHPAVPPDKKTAVVTALSATPDAHQTEVILRPR